MFVENVLNDMLRRARESATAIKAHEAEYGTEDEPTGASEEKDEDDGKDDGAEDGAADEGGDDGEEPGRLPEDPPTPPRPIEVTFEKLLATELAPFLVSSADSSKGLRTFTIWTTEEPVEAEVWEALPDFDQVPLSNALATLRADGQYGLIPTQFNGRLTKALVRNIKLEPARQLELEEVQDEVFDAFVEKRGLDRAVELLEKLRTELEKAAPDDDSARDAALAEWVKGLAGPHYREETGLFIGSVPPPPTPIDDDDEEEGPADEVEPIAHDDPNAPIARRNFVQSAGYETVRRLPSRQDNVEASPGTFGRRVLRDPRETQSAYLIRVKDRVFPVEGGVLPASVRAAPARSVLRKPPEPTQSAAAQGPRGHALPGARALPGRRGLDAEHLQPAYQHRPGPHRRPAVGVRRRAAPGPRPRRPPAGSAPAVRS